MNKLFLRMLIAVTLMFSSLTAMSPQQAVPEVSAPVSIQPQAIAIPTAPAPTVTQPITQTLTPQSTEDLSNRIAKLEERANKLSDRLKTHGALIYQKLPQQIQQTKQQVQQFAQQIQPFIQQQIQQLQQQMQQQFQQLLQLLTQKFPALAPAAKRFLSQAQSTIVQKYKSLKAKKTAQGTQPSATTPSTTAIPTVTPLPVVTPNPTAPVPPAITQTQ